MSVLLLVLVALPGGLVTTLLLDRHRAAFSVGLATAVLSVVAAASIGAADVVSVAGSVIGGSDGLRTLSVAWALSVLLFGVIDALLGLGPGILGAALVSLAFGAVGLAVPDPGIGFAILGAGAILSAVIPIAGTARVGNAGRRFGLATIRPLVASTIMGLLVVAWGASAAGPLSSSSPSGAVDPSLVIAMGMALLAMVAAVVLRIGAIPAHAWAARYVEGMPASAVPPLLGWGSAAFTLVALAWVEVTITPIGARIGTEQAVIAVVAVAGILLGGLAAVLHEDIEHVLMYAIVQDAGIALLAFASGGSTATAAGRDWIVAAVAVKAGLAAWVHVTRSVFGSNRRSDLSGWVRRAPLLGIAFGAVLLGAIGLPTFAGFEARATLVRLALPGPIGAIVLVGSFAPLIYLGRLLVDGVGPMSTTVRGVAGGLVEGPSRTGSWTGDRSPRRLVPVLLREHRLTLAASCAVAVAVLGLAISIGGLASTVPGGGIRGASPSGAVPSPAPTITAAPS